MAAWKVKRFGRRKEASKIPVEKPKLLPTDLTFSSAPKNLRNPKELAGLLTAVWKIRRINSLDWGNWATKGPNEKLKPNVKLGGTYFQLLMRLVNFPEGQIIVRDPSEKIIGAIHGIPGRINGIEDVPKKYREVSVRMRGRKPTKMDNAIYCISVTSDPRRRGEIKYAGVGLVGNAVLKAYSLGFEHIFAYSAPRTYLAEKKKEPSLTVREHFDKKQDGVLHKFHARQFEFKPQGNVVALFENARPEDRQSGGACALVHYSHENIEKWIIESQKSIQPWLKQYGIEVANGKIVRRKASGQ